MPELLTHVSEYKRNSLEHKQCVTARRLLLRRAGYEGEALWDISRARRIARKGLEHARDAAAFLTWVRSLDILLERERVLLRIKLPGVERPQEREVSSSSRPSIFITEKPKPAMAAQPAPAGQPVEQAVAPSQPSATGLFSDPIRDGNLPDSAQ